MCGYSTLRWIEATDLNITGDDMIMDYLIEEVPSHSARNLLRDQSMISEFHHFNQIALGGPHQLALKYSLFALFSCCLPPDYQHKPQAFD